MPLKTVGGGKGASLFATSVVPSSSSITPFGSDLGPFAGLRLFCAAEIGGESRTIEIKSVDMKDRMVREEMTELNWPDSSKDIAKVPLGQTVGLSFLTIIRLLLCLSSMLCRSTRLKTLFWFWYGYTNDSYIGRGVKYSRYAGDLNFKSFPSLLSRSR